VILSFPTILDNSLTTRAQAALVSLPQATVIIIKIPQRKFLDFFEFVIACSLPLSVLQAGLVAASRVVPVLLAWPWQPEHRFRIVVGGTAIFSSGSMIFVDKYGGGNQSLSRRLGCGRICGA